MTKNRKLILDIINSSHHHPTAEDIWELARQSVPGISLATVYNNLSALCEENLIRRITSGNSSKCAVHYDKITPMHEHIVCDMCNGITDIKIDGLIEDVENKTGMNFSSYDLILHHICPNCRNA